MANEPGSAVLAIFDQLVNRVKQTQPVRSDDKPLGGGVVYSMLPLGMPVDPVDYMNPWTPQGDINVKDAVAQGTAPTAPASTSSASGDAPPPPPDPKAARALAAAYKTAVLCDTMLQVTSDGSYLQYPTGRHLSFSYDSIISAMQPITSDEPADPKVVAAVDKARKVLFELNDDGTISTTKTKKYKTYLSDSLAYGQAKAAYASAFAAAKSDPNQMQIWPVTSITYQNAVDQARDQLISDGAEDIENALDTLNSVGNPIQAHMVSQARELYDVWNLGLTGSVPAKIPYSFILPTGWADPDDDDDGWQHLTVTSSSYSHYDVQHASSQSQFSWFNKSSSTGGGGSVGIGFVSLGGSGSSSSSSQGSQGSSGSQSSQVFGSDAKNLSISLEYALCEIQRPYLVSDLFYMLGWYLKGGKKNSISTGKLADQVGNANQLLPMIPQQLLVIRNVKISTSQWGSAGSVLQSMYGSSQQSSSASSSSVGGSAGVSFGFISFGGSVSHTQSSAQGQGSSFSSRDGSSYFGTTFDGQTLTIPGAQIIAFLSDIVPTCPPVDDPQLAATPAAATPAAATKTTATATKTTAASGTSTKAAG
jgi:hypothetical protein